MGWYQINTWGRIVTPDPEPIWMQAAPWSASTNGAVSGEIVFIPLTDAVQLDVLKGTLKGKIVLLGEMRLIPDLSQPLSYRYTDEELQELECPGVPRRLTGPPPDNPTQQVQAERQRRTALRERSVKMMQDEGVAAILLSSREEGRSFNTGLILDDNGTDLKRQAQLRENAVPVPCAAVLTEHYNRLVRLAQVHVPVTVEVNIQTAFTGDHKHGFNTVAEIPGTDLRLKNQIVMVGGHLDSWISGTGATDNGAGAVIAMEAVRILEAPKSMLIDTLASSVLPLIQAPRPHPVHLPRRRSGKTWTLTTTLMKAAVRRAVSTRRATMPSHPSSSSGSLR